MDLRDIKHSEKSAVVASIIAITISLLFAVGSCHGQTTIKQLQKDLNLLKYQIVLEKDKLQPIVEMAKIADKHAQKFMLYNKKLSYDEALKYGFYVEKYSRIRNIDSDLVVAIIITESHAKYEAVSHMGAIGLMQIHYKVWKKEIKKTRKELFNPETNIKYGTYILKHYLDRYNNNVFDAVTAYNTGSRKKSNNKYTTKVFNTYFNIKSEK